MSTRSDVMDLDSRPMEAHHPRILNYVPHVNVDQLERQRLYQLQIQQLHQQDMPQQQQQYQQHPPPHEQHPTSPSSYSYQLSASQSQLQQLQQQQRYQQHIQQQQQQQQQPGQYQYYQDIHQPPVFYQQQEQQQQQQKLLYPVQSSQAHQPNQSQQGWKTSDYHPITPSSEETEMPSLAFSDGTMTASRAMLQSQNQSQSLSPSSSSPPGAVDVDSNDPDFFLTTVLNMIAPAGIPTVALYDYDAEFTHRELFAKGGNGEIRRAFWTLRKTTVILKCLIDRKHTPEKIARLFDKEVEVLSRCQQHDNIVDFFGVAVRNSDDDLNGQRFMIMQYCEHGDLVKLLETPPQAPEAPTMIDKVYLALDIAQGLDHLFKCGFHHGDLHPKNILIDVRRDCTPHQGRYQAKLTDFGLRRIRDSRTAFSSQQFGGVWQFMAPERMPKNRPRYDIRCDIFALGVIYWFIMAGRYPFKDPSTFSPGAREERIDGTPNWYYNVYTQAWSEDPNSRQQTFDEIVQAFRFNLGIHTPPTQYLSAGHAYHQYPTHSHGYDGSTSTSYPAYDGHHQHLYSGSSGGGSTIRGSPMLTPASMLTPMSLGRASQHPPSPLMANSPTPSSSAGRSNNPNHPRYRKAVVPNGLPPSVSRQ
ncbi:hypothetical protein BGZ58_009784 [Dissophora ornata]|nr:hypothetical protein BGZ58_009784 [Dissophora ornata]